MARFLQVPPCSFAVYSAFSGTDSCAPSSPLVNGTSSAPASAEIGDANHLHLPLPSPLRRFGRPLKTGQQVENLRSYSLTALASTTSSFAKSQASYIKARERMPVSVALRRPESSASASAFPRCAIVGLRAR